jgi:hypothetical protein
MPGMSLKAKYQSDLVYEDRAALMRLRSSGSLVINKLGPIRARDPFKISYFPQCKFNKMKYKPDTHRISLQSHRIPDGTGVSRQLQQAIDWTILQAMALEYVISGGRICTMQLIGTQTMR